MKGEKVAGASTRSSGSSTMSEFFRHGSAEEKREVYRLAASIAIDEQRDVIRAAKSGEFSVAKSQ